MIFWHFSGSLRPGNTTVTASMAEFPDRLVVFFLSLSTLCSKKEALHEFWARFLLTCCHTDGARTCLGSFIDIRGILLLTLPSPIPSSSYVFRPPDQRPLSSIWFPYATRAFSFFGEIRFLPVFCRGALPKILAFWLTQTQGVLHQ